MPRNIEIKAVLPNRDAVLAAAAKKCELGPETILQHDFFFRCSEGRLKLRVLGPERGELIQYERQDVAGPRGSHYEIAHTSDPGVLLDILSRTLGRVGEVKKTRILYHVGQTRVHIDKVEGLGDFLELEVVLRPDQTDGEAQHIAESLLREFGIEKNQLTGKAYVDLLFSGSTEAVNCPELVPEK
jgi:predicted adenylyl cyclase CyaB